MNTISNVTVFLAVVFMCALNSCQRLNREDRELSKCDSLLIGRKILTLDMPVYEVDLRFSDILDSVIMVEKQCGNYRECVTGFTFTVPASDSLNRVSIGATNILRYDYSDSYGIFNYQGFRFICSGDSAQSFLKKSDQTTKIDYLDFDRVNDWFKYSDEYSGWYLVVSDTKILIEGHYPCPVDSSQYAAKE